MFFTQKRHARKTKAERDAKREENFRRRFQAAQKEARVWL